MWTVIEKKNINSPDIIGRKRRTDLVPDFLFLASTFDKRYYLSCNTSTQVTYLVSRDTLQNKHGGWKTSLGP